LDDKRTADQHRNTPQFIRSKAASILPPHRNTLMSLVSDREALLVEAAAIDAEAEDIESAATPMR
jgi:hypothetical protein